MGARTSKRPRFTADTGPGSLTVLVSLGTEPAPVGCMLYGPRGQSHASGSALGCGFPCTEARGGSSSVDTGAVRGVSSAGDEARGNGMSGVGDLFLGQSGSPSGATGGQCRCQMTAWRSRREGSLRDEVGANGQPPGNGVPDFIDLYQGRSAVFVADDVSAGTKFDFTIRRNANHVDRGVVPNVSDELSNAYAYLTNDAAGRPLLFAGIERLNAGASTVELEFNQGLFRLGRGWPGRTGWEILGRRTSKDLLVTLSFGADGLLSSVGIDSWEDLSGAGSFGWLRKETLTGEGCNRGDPNAVPPTSAGTMCAFCNAASIPGGGWVSYDAAGQPETTLSSDTFLEIGLNVGSLLGISDRTLYGYSTIQLRTRSDIALRNSAGSTT